jgi:hypothetical protein
MNGIDSVGDDESILVDGILTCKGVISDTIKTGDLQTINLNVENNITGGESMAIGRDVAVGRTLICPNIFTTKLITNTIETKNVKTEKVDLYNNLLKYTETNVGHITRSKLILLIPMELKNTLKTIVSVPLHIGIFIVSYSFSLELTASTGGVFTEFTHGLSTDNLNYNVISRNFYGNITFGNPYSNPVFNETSFYHNTDYNGSINLIVNHNTLTNGNSLIVLKNVKVTALRIA